MTDVEIVAEELLREGTDDWVPLDLLIWHAREASRGSAQDFRDFAVRALRYLLAEGLMEVGDIGESGFEAWREPPDEIISRVVSACDEVNWEPRGGLFWLANTESGDRRVQ